MATAAAAGAITIALTETISQPISPSCLSLAELLTRLQETPVADLAAELCALRAANVAHHVELIRIARRRYGAHVICLGELFTGPYFATAPPELASAVIATATAWHALAEDAEQGPTVTRLRQVAQEEGLIIIAPLYELEQTPSGARRFNTAVVIDSDGSLLGKYRKNHIPWGQNEAGAFVEQHFYERSDGGSYSLDAAGRPQRSYFPVFRSRSGVCFGVLICYDRHFEGCAAALARQGAQLIFCPAVTFGQKSRHFWPLEFQVDAMRHRIFFAGSNRRGQEHPWDASFFGGSLVAGPDGLLPSVSNDHDLIIVQADLRDLQKVDSAGWHLSRDARPEIFSPTS